jgi:hypothetical protein
VTSSSAVQVHIELSPAGEHNIGEIITTLLPFGSVARQGASVTFVTDNEGVGKVIDLHLLGYFKRWEKDNPQRWML